MFCPCLCQAAEIKNNANQLIEQNRYLMADVETQKLDTAKLFDDGIRQQQIADELLADADAARAMAKEAVAKAEGTLKEANDTLKTLTGMIRLVPVLLYWLILVLIVMVELT